VLEKDVGVCIERAPAFWLKKKSSSSFGASSSLLPESVQ